MQELNSKIATTKSKIKEVDQKINELRKVSVFLYSNGEVEIESTIDIMVLTDNSQLSSIFKSILDNELAGNLTINQLKGLTKYLCIENILRSKNLTYEAIFDNPEMEIFYKNLKKE